MFLIIKNKICSFLKTLNKELARVSSMQYEADLYKMNSK